MIYDFVVDEILELSNFIFMGIEKPNETHKSEKKINIFGSKVY